jgi:hypothetical protein
MLEAIENNWDDILHEALHYPIDAFGRNQMHDYDIELGASLWETQSVPIV